jgi:NAD(P)-dependent dehydrogenase (short-subunit alcohol dehydrogenase family)
VKLAFDGRHALVTGGNKGIGKAIALRLAASGAKVTATGTDQSALDALKGTAGITPVALDLSDDASIATYLSKAPAIDILVNNAGINRHARVGDLDLDDFDDIMRINVRGAVALCKGLVPGMAARGWGRVVNVTSIFSTVAKSARASYATSKFALAGFTKALALDYASQGVLANAVAPGFIGTEMTARMLGEKGIAEMTAQVPVGRLGTPEEVANLVAFLASAENSFITGQNILIDGGFTST